MVKIFGAVLVMAGATGFSVCMCRELRERLMLLGEVRYMYILMQNEIRYSILPMPYLLEELSDKLRSPLSDLLQTVGRRMQKSDGEIFSDLWRKEAELCLLKMPLKKEQKESILRFPECMGMIDKEGQVKALQQKVEELDGWIKGQEKEIKEKNKVIMSLGIGAGFLLIIVLF